MKFGELTQELFAEKIKPLLIRNDVACIIHFADPCFHKLQSIDEKVTSLMSLYQFQPDYLSLDRLITKLMRTNTSKLDHARTKLVANGMYAEGNLTNYASLKLHINLNQILQLDEAVILGLMDLLFTEMLLSHNDINFSFKIVNPRSATNARFKDTDQLTLYFDPYSSLEAFFHLTEKIAQYLKQHIPENEKNHGPNDNWVLNPFVSSRFDTNKLHSRYGVFPFFDIELAKFFSDKTNQKWKKVPLYIFEIVFNVIICDKAITEIAAKLNEQDSNKVQQELSCAMNDPKKYVQDALEKVAPEFKANKDKAKQDLGIFLNKLKDWTFDFSHCIDEEKLSDYSKKEHHDLDSLLHSFIDEHRTSQYFNLEIYESFGLIFGQKKLAVDERVKEWKKPKKASKNQHAFFVESLGKTDIEEPVASGAQLK